jgi:hypothetical protein
MIPHPWFGWLLENLYLVLLLRPQIREWLRANRLTSPTFFNLCQPERLKEKLFKTLEISRIIEQLREKTDLPFLSILLPLDPGRLMDKSGILH